MKKAYERLLDYVSFDTQSDDYSDTCPTTAKQKILGAHLVEEMLAMGISDAYMDENGYVYGTVPGDPSMPTIGLIAHMDTSPDASGADIKTKIVEYNGGDILLNEEKGIYLRETDYESLKRNVGKHLIVTDGTTLLGADDKAGIAEILTAAEMLMNSDKKHATIRIAFTPDEEVGKGTDCFNLKDFHADYGYTCDGGTIGEMEYECFNAASGLVEVKGLSIHPGSAKDKLVNSMMIAIEFENMMPVQSRPEFTSGYEGFIMLHNITGDVEKTTMRYIIRDHSMTDFLAKKKVMEDAAEFLNRKYGEGTVKVTLRDSYYNMREKIEPAMYIVDRALAAMKKVGMDPKVVPVRGGTDGARLSYEGLLCPNLCTGGENYHGRFEYIPVEDMDTCTDMLVELLTNF